MSNRIRKISTLKVQLAVLTFLILLSCSRNSAMKRARALETSGNTNDAILILRKEIQDNPENLRAYKELGYLYSKSSRYNEAGRIWSKASEMNPEDEEILNALFQVYRAGERFDEALQVKLKLLEVDGENPFHYLDIADLYMHSADYNRCMEWAVKAYNTGCPNWQPNFKIGLSLLALGKYQESRQTYVNTLNTGEKLHLGDPETAISDLRTLLRDTLHARSAQQILLEVFGIDSQSIKIPQRLECNNLVNFTKPQVTKRVEPEFPEFARRFDVDVEVLIKVLIDEAGKVAKAEVIRAGSAEFNRVSLEAVRQFEFEPAEANGKRVQCWLTIPFSYKTRRSSR